MLEDNYPAEAAFFAGEDLGEDAYQFHSQRQQRLSGCERNVLQIKPRIESVEAIHHTNPRYISAAEYIETMEAGLPQWRDTLQDEMFADQELRELGIRYNRLLGSRSPISSQIVELTTIKNGEEPEYYTQFNVERIKEHAEAAQEPCENEFLTSSEPFTTYEQDSALHPENACQFAQNWQDYTVHYLTLEGLSMANGLYTTFAEIAAEIVEDGRFNYNDHHRMTDMASYVQHREDSRSERFAHADATLPAEVQTAFARLSELEENFLTSYNTTIQVDRWNPQFDGKHSDVQSSLRSVL